MRHEMKYIVTSFHYGKEYVHISFHCGQIEMKLRVENIFLRVDIDT